MSEIHLFENSFIYIIIFPIISFLLGVLFNYEIRKVSARLQSRQGPWLLVPKSLRKTMGTTRLLQPLYDVLKLLFKQSIIPETARSKLFIGAPFIALFCLIAASILTPLAGYFAFSPFELSLVVLLYLLLAIPFAFILGGAVSSSPWGVVGSQREAELMLAYETPLVIGAFTIAIMADSLSLHEILKFQFYNYPFLILNPFAAIAVIFGIVGKIHLKPFDIPEAEVEIVAGPSTEFSGKLLGILEIDKILLTSVSVSLFINLFLAGGAIPGMQHYRMLTVLFFLLEGFLIICFVTLIHTLNPRLRIDQALRWYVKIPIMLAVLGLIWAYFVRYFIIAM